jgi:hypothetical protein
MKKSKFTAVALAMAIAFSPVAALAQPAPAPVPTHAGATPWWIFICPGGIVTAAMVKNWKRNKQLTTPEAWTCGLLYWWNEGTGKYGR